MAGLTASGPLSNPPLLFRPKLKPSPSPPPLLSLSSTIDHHLYAAALRHRAATSTTAVAAFSGRSRGKRSSYDDEYGDDDDDDDKALDVASIRSTEVRLIDEQQNMVGVVSKSEALRRAEDAKLDLVVISLDADPPVVKIMNYDKYRYEQQKKKRDQQKKSLASRMDVKELKMGYNIDVHDYTVRLKAAQKFLKDGHKVKAIVNLKGRGNSNLEKAAELVKKFQNDLGELATEEFNNFSRKKREDITDRFIFMILTPKKNAPPKTQEAPKKGDSASIPANEVSAGV